LRRKILTAHLLYWIYRYTMIVLGLFFDCHKKTILKNFSRDMTCKTINDGTPPQIRETSLVSISALRMTWRKGNVEDSLCIDNWESNVCISLYASRYSKVWPMWIFECQIECETLKIEIPIVNPNLVCWSQRSNHSSIRWSWINSGTVGIFIH